MTPTELRAKQAPFKNKYKDDPGSGLVTMRAVATLQVETVSCRLKFEVAPLVPKVRVPPPLTSNRTPKAVDVVKFPLTTVSPGPSKTQARLAVNAFAVTPPLKVTALPATTLLMVLTLLAAAAKLRGWLNVRP